MNEVPCLRGNKAPVYVFSILDWGGAENKIYLSNISEDFVSHLYVPTEKKKKKAPRVQGL